MAEILAALGPLQLLAIAVTLVVASLLRAFSGFGFALAAVPVLSLFIAPAEAVVLAAALALSANLFSIGSWRRDYSPRDLLPLLLTTLIGTALGVWWLSGLSTAQFQLWIGLAVLLACFVLSVYHPKRQPPRPLVGAVVGLLAGLMNGAFAIPGPPVIVYAMTTETEGRRSRAMLMYFFVFASTVALVSFGFAGYLTLRTLQLYLLALPAMLIGDKLGVWLFLRYGHGAYRRFALLLLYAIGIAITARAMMS